MASEVEDSELIALRSAVLASIKQPEAVTESNQTDDDEDLEALREAALLSRKKLQNNIIQNNVNNSNRGNSHSYKRRINNSFHSHNRNGNHKRNLERSNLIVINPVPIVTAPTDNNSIIPTSKLLISNSMKNVMISDDSSSPKMVYSKSKGYNRFSRFESESYSDSDSDSSDYGNDRSDDFICSDEKEIFRENDISSVDVNKQDMDLLHSTIISNSAEEFVDDFKLSSCDDKLQTDNSIDKKDENILVINSPDENKIETLEEPLIISDEKETIPCKPGDNLKPSTGIISDDVYKREHTNNQETLSKTIRKDECGSEKLVDRRKEKSNDSDSLKNHSDKTSERKEISFNSSKNDSLSSKYLGWDLRMQLNCNNKSRSPSVNSLSSRSPKSISRSRSPSPVLKSVLSVVKQVPERKSRSERRSRNKKESSIVSRRRRDSHKSQRDVFCVISSRRSEKNNDDTKKCASSAEDSRKLPVYMRLGVSVKNIHKSSKRNSSSSPSEDHHKEKRIKVIKCSTSDCEKQRRVTFSRSDDDRCHGKHHKENSITEHKKKSSEKKSGRKEKRSHLHRKR